MSHAPQNPRPRSLALRIVLGMGLAAGLLVLLELGLRAYIRVAARDEIYRPHPTRFWTLRSNLNQVPKVTLEMDGTRLVTLVSTSSQGLRSPWVSPHKPAGAWRVVCMGDSTTFGHGISEADSFPRRLEALLRRAYPQRPCQVINAGVPGYSSYQGLDLFGEKCRALQPDLVVVGYFYSDLINDVAADQDRLTSPAWVRSLQKILYQSELYLLFRRELLTRHPHLPGSGSLVPRVSLDQYRANLRELAREVRQGGGEVMFLNLPYGSAAPPPALVPYRQALWDTAVELNAPCIDLDQYFIDHIAQWDQLFLDPIHPSSRGHALIAGQLLKALEAGLGPAPQPGEAP